MSLMTSQVLRSSETKRALESSLSPERLQKYLHSTGGDLDTALSLYERNMRLASAFYVPLQCLEVCLRNKLHMELTQKYSSDWYTNGKVELSRDTAISISNAIHQIENSKSGMTAGAVIAELSFGFWVSILGRRYDATIWRSALTKAFKDNGKNMKRDPIHQRLNALRRFRNRVAHHEPIFDRDLTAVHSELIEAIGWLCPRTADWTFKQSQVLNVIASA